MRTLILGLGNPLRADDAVGLHVARALVTRVPPGISVVALEGAGLDVAEAMVGFDRVVMVDAMHPALGIPGSFRELPLEHAFPGDAVESHQGSLPVALEALRHVGLPVPSRVTVVGVVARDLTSVTEHMSADVERAVPRVVEHILSGLDRAVRLGEASP